MLNMRRLSASSLKKTTWIVILFSIVLLAACSTVKKDGPPGYNVDVSRIPDAKPKVEAKSRIGNKPYIVFGKRYHVMNTSKNYKERGIASWYGSKFHSRHTSSGEPYDMLAMTAAHKSLPLPTYVKVKNLNTGKTVVVKVNDRGPFASNRIIDLSYAAAKKLGIVGHGTAKVEITSIDPRDMNTPSHASTFFAKNTSTKSMTHPMKKNGVMLQVGAFRNKSYAEKLKKDIESITHSPVCITQVNGSTKLYRVQVGPIKDETSVSKINKQLSSIGLYGKVLLA